MKTIGKDQMTSLYVLSSSSFQIFLTLFGSYLQAHNIVRSITGLGEGNGPFIAIHDGFQGLGAWANFLEGSDRIAMGKSLSCYIPTRFIDGRDVDTHPYFAFDGAANTAPIDVQLQGSTDATQFGGQWPSQACNAWGASMNQRYVCVHGFVQLVLNSSPVARTLA